MTYNTSSTSPPLSSPKSTTSSLSRVSSFSSFHSIPPSHQYPISPTSNSTANRQKLTQNSQLTQYCNRLFQKHGPSKLHSLLKKTQSDLQTHQRQLRDILKGHHTEFLQMAESMEEMRQEADEIANLLIPNENSPQLEHKEETRESALEQQQDQSSLYESKPDSSSRVQLFQSPYDTFFVLKQLIHQRLYLHASVLLHFTSSKRMENNSPPHLNIMRQDILRNLLKYENGSGTNNWSQLVRDGGISWMPSNYCVDMDICQRFLAYCMLQEKDTELSKPKHLFEQFLSFQHKCLTSYVEKSASHHSSGPSFSPQMVSHHIYTFLLGYLFFTSDILLKQCKHMTVFLRRIVECVTLADQVNLPQVYNVIYQHLFSVYLNSEMDFSQEILRADETELLSNSHVEKHLREYHKETLPLLEQVIQSLLDQCEQFGNDVSESAEGITPSSALLMIYDHLVTLLNTCHIQFNQHTFLFDTQDISVVWSRSHHQDNVMPDLRNLLDRLFTRKQNQLVQTSFQQARSSIESHLKNLSFSDLKIALNLREDEYSASKSTENSQQITTLKSIESFVQNHNQKEQQTCLPSDLWQNLSVSENLLLDRYSSSMQNILSGRESSSQKAIPSSSSFTHTLHHASFDPLINDITSFIFGKVLSQKIAALEALIERERQLGPSSHHFSSNSAQQRGTDDGNIEEFLRRSILQCIQDTVYPYIQEHIDNAEAEISPEEGYKYQPSAEEMSQSVVSSDLLSRQLFYGRLTQAVEKSFHALMLSVSRVGSNSGVRQSRTISKESEELLGRFDELYIDCHRLWIHYLCSRVHQELNLGVHYYIDQLSVEEWPSVTFSSGSDDASSEQEESVRVPNAPSPFLLRIIQHVNDRVFNIGSYTLKSELIPILCQRLSQVYVSFFTSFLQSEEAQKLEEHGAVQLLFDLRVLSSILYNLPFERLSNKVHANTSDIPQHQKHFVSLVDMLHEKYIDAINWETYEKHFESNLQSHLHSHHLHYGLRVFSHVNTGKKKRVKRNASSSTFVATSQSVGAPFTLLPVHNLTQYSSRAETPDTVTPQQGQTSKIASFFKGFGW